MADNKTPPEVSSEEKSKTIAPAVAEGANAAATGARVMCFVAKREVPESEAVQMPYLNGEKVWVSKSLVKFKN